MKLKYLLISFLFTVCLGPIQAKDILLESANIQQTIHEMNNEYRQLLAMELSSNKPKILNPEDVEKMASDIVDRLYKAFNTTTKDLNINEFENLTKALKMDIIKLSAMPEHNIDLLQAFVEAYQKRSMIYPEMQNTLDLFLIEITDSENLIGTLKLGSSDPKLARKITEINIQNKTWQKFLTKYRKDILSNLIKRERPVLAEFSQMIESTLSTTIPQEERQIVTKVSILNDMISVAEKEYDMTRETARYGRAGARAELRADALQKYFGELKIEDAEFINEILEKTNPSSLEKMLPEAKGWIQGFSRWSERSLKPKSNVILSIGAMVAIVVVGELIREYERPSTYYLSAIDEINDSLEIGNYIDLVYKSVYDNKFAQVFDTVFEEDLNEEEQLMYGETLAMFNRAVFDVFLKETEEKINKEIYNCFHYGTDCA